jgi:hypothetical protein
LAVENQTGGAAWLKVESSLKKIWLFRAGREQEKNPAAVALERFGGLQDVNAGLHHRPSRHWLGAEI